MPNRTKAPGSVHTRACAGPRNLTAPNGESKREIARVEGIGRDTVGRILSQQEVVETIARYQSQLLDMVPKAIGL